MCGICGYVVRKNSKPPSIQTLKKMNNMLRHRGPNEVGISHNKYAGLAMRRLSIIDVADGHQPVYSLNKEVMAVFNGEIYNYIELRDVLVKKGYRFKTPGDSEIIPAMYLEYGSDMFGFINGMFAIALWDFRTKSCCLCRDRFGQKPLYLAEHKGVFYFASEMKSLLVVPEFPKKINTNALKQYLYLGQIAGPATPFEKINSLPPGHFLEITPDGKKHLKQYWDIHIPSAYEKRSYNKHRIKYYLDELDVRIKKSVGLRLRSDVPVATTLSGGLDSSLILYYAGRISGQPAESFSVTFDGAIQGDDAWDESDYQGDVIKKLNINSHFFDFFKHKQEIAESLPRAYWINETPDSIAQQEIMFTFLAGMMYREGFKVGLGGEGADELNRGYDWYAPGSFPLAYLNGNLNIPERLRYQIKEERWFVDEWGFPSSIYGEPLAWRRVQRLFTAGHLPPPFKDETPGGPLHTDFTTHVPVKKFKELSGVELLQYSDIKIRLPDFILHVQDRFSMAGSIEMRSPFLDHSLAEWLVTLPERLLRKNNNEKYLLKRLMKSRLPSSVLKRKKQGYSAPHLQTDYGCNGSTIKELMTGESLEDLNIINPDFVKQLNKVEKKLKRNYRTTPASWVACPEGGLSAPQIFLERVEDIQFFLDIFIRRFDEFAGNHK